MEKKSKRKEGIRTNNNPNIFYVALASGLYPLIHFYSFNLSLSDSPLQITFLILLFLVSPILILGLISLIISRFKVLKKHKNYSLAVANLVLFTCFVIYVLRGGRLVLMSIAVIAIFVISFFVYNHLKKIVLLQYILAIVALISFVPNIYAYFNQSLTWLQQPDDIEAVTFNDKPNVYYIQVDGYANFSELKQAPYSFDVATFESRLNDKGFKLYPSYRSNYYSTLSSNLSIFSMKHHYYFNTKSLRSEIFNARDIIVGENTVNSIFKSNGYKLFMFVTDSYLLRNMPESNYDYTNMKYNQLSILGHHTKGIQLDIKEDLKSKIISNKTTNNFFFIEKMLPMHIANLPANESNSAEQREDYLLRLKETNIWLDEILDFIVSNDPNSLVVLSSDHGGYVGLNNFKDVFTKQTNPHLVRSIFSSVLAIKWPENQVKYDDSLKTNVNLFRVIFSSLANDREYLENLQDDSSYGIIHKGAPLGVYKHIDENNKIVFKKYQFTSD